MQPAKMLLTTAIIVVIVFGAPTVTQAAEETDDPVALLNKGIELFDSYRYHDAGKALRKARKADQTAKKLTKNQREQLATYLDSAAKAYSHQVQACEYIDVADKLLKRSIGSTELKQAEAFYRKALVDREYLPPERIRKAEDGLKRIAERRSATGIQAPVSKTTSTDTQLVVSKTTTSAPAPAVTPVAKSELRATPKVTPVAAKPRPSQPTLLDQVLAAKKIQREQALATFRDAERNVRTAVLIHNFLAARDTLRQARQQVYASRKLFSQHQFAELQLRIDSLAKFIDTEEQAYQRKLIIKQVKEADERKRQREEKAQEDKYNKISQLFEKARTLKRNGQFDEAIDTCHQILAIEANFDRAKWMIEDLLDEKDITRQAEIQDTVVREARKTLTDADEARIGYADIARYPPDWREKVRSRKQWLRKLGREAELEPPAQATLRTLRSRMIDDPATIVGTDEDRKTLRDVLKAIGAQGLNLITRWDVLDLEGVSPDDEVNYETLSSLRRVPLKTIIELLLKTVGAEINYAIDTDGIVVVSTRDDLTEQNLTPRIGRLETRVYSIADIMSYQPSLSGVPSVEPEQEQQALQREDTQAEEFEELTSLEDLVDVLRDLMTRLVRPESWVEGGGEGTIDVWRNRWLFIYQSPEVHDEVAELLAKLRQEQKIQIAIEARFVTVSSNFLERIGLDLDVVLNQGHAGYDWTGVENTFGGNASTGAGMHLLQQRQYSYLGTLPVSPVAATADLPVTYQQPYGHLGLVPVGGNTGPRTTKMTPIPFLNASETLVGAEDTGLPGNLVGQAIRPAFQVMAAFLDDMQVNFMLEATQMDRYSSIVQAPRVVVQNGTFGYVGIETNVPYVESIQVTAGESAAGVEPTVETESFGTVLGVRPTTRDLQYVSMYINPSVTVRAADADLTVRVPVVSAGAVGETVYVYPGRRTTQVQSLVTVPDEGTLLIGGLKQCGEIETEAGVPVLSKLPIIKRFFTHRALTRDNFTLLILVKPEIIVQPEVEEKLFGTVTFQSR